MRRIDVEKLSDSLEYGRAKYRLTKVKDPELRKRYEEIIRNYEIKYSIKMVVLPQNNNER